MRRLLAISAVLAALLAPASDAGAAKSLSGATAKRYAERAATNRASRNHAIAGWDIARGFRFTSRKWVFVWYAQMRDGTVCAAQLVTRYASSKSTKVVAYFRQEVCS